MSLVRQAAIPVALLVGGVLVALLAGDSTPAIAVAISLVGCAFVVAIALAFFAVGRAEERDREEVAAARARRGDPGTADHGADPHRHVPHQAAEPADPHAAERPRTLGLGPDRRRRRPPRRPG